MTRYLATVNIPGYLPMDDDPPMFDSPREAWAYLADERRRDEDHDDTADEYSDTVRTLDYLASDEHQDGNPLEDTPTDIDGTGTVYGDTPGSDSPHDLGLAYSVTALEGSTIGGTFWACDDCVLARENGEVPEGRPASEPAVWALWESDPHDVANNCGGDDGEGDQDFSTSPCGACGSTLHGSRHRYVWFD
jgi:hypothetical protein